MNLLCVLCKVSQRSGDVWQVRVSLWSHKCLQRRKIVCLKTKLEDKITAENGGFEQKKDSSEELS